MDTYIISYLVGKDIHLIKYIYIKYKLKDIY